MIRLFRSSGAFVLVAVLVMVSLVATACGSSGQPTASQPAASGGQASSKAAQSPGQSAAAKTGGTIKIGAALSATGPIAREGSLMKKGYDLWKDTVNAKGGIEVGGAKYMVEIIYYDDKGDATTGTKLVEKLITEDKVDLIFGPFGSGVTQATSAISEKYQKIMIAPIANAEAIYSRGFKYLFGNLPPITEGFGQHIDYIKTLDPKIEKLAIIFPDDLYPTSAAEVAKKKADAAGINVAYFQKFPKGTRDLAPVVAQIKSSGADGLIMSGYLEDLVLFIKTAKELKLNLKYLGGMGVPTDDLVKNVGGKDADFVFDAPWWLPISGWKGPLFGTSEEFNNLFKKTYNEDATYFSSAAANAGLILQMAMEKAGSVDPEKVRATLPTLDVETFAGPLKYDNTGFNRAGKGLIIQVRNGKAEVAFPAKLQKDKPVYPIPNWDNR